MEPKMQSQPAILGDSCARGKLGPWTRYDPMRTGCSSANFLCSPWARGFGGPCARGRLGLLVLLLLHSVLVHKALGWSSLSLVMLLSFLVVFLFIPKEA